MISWKKMLYGFVTLIIISVFQLPAQTPWLKHPDPVFEYGIATTVLFHENIYKMWYEGNDGFGYATSPDGLIWTRDSINYPLLEPGPPGSWDEQEVNHASVLIHNNSYHMWYSGVDAGHDNRIGHATSLDGISWSKDSANPVLNLGTTAPWDTNEAIHPSVIFENDTFKMFYNGYGGNTQRILYAYSSDGTNWTGYTAHPMLEPGAFGTWDGWELGPLCVLNDGNEYHMWYTGFNDSTDTATVQIGYAESPDGLLWTRGSPQPVLTPGDPGDWDEIAVAIPNVIREGDLFKMWYGGTDGNSFATGYATAPFDYIKPHIGNLTEVYQLQQNYPNPYNPSTHITYLIPHSGWITLTLYDLLGKEITTLVDMNQSAGSYTVTYDASHLASGIYIYTLRADQYIKSRKMILLR